MTPKLLQRDAFRPTDFKVEFLCKEKKVLYFLIESGSVESHLSQCLLDR